jgi:predicted DsbA family dithiol-disulfide isomerase
MPDSPPTIEVFADLWCTFAHVGLRMAADQRRQSGREDVVFVVRAWPLELVNGTPMDAQKVGEHVHELQEHVAPQLFRHVDLEHFPSTTLPGLALVARAYRHELRLGERAAFLLRDALFEHGQDIGDTVVLQRLADELGCGMPDALDDAAVLDEYAGGQRRGVVGSPHWFHGDGNVFCPALEIARGDAGLIIHENTARLQQFLAHSFASPD